MNKNYMPGKHFLQLPGPSNVPDRILRAMDYPTIDHRGPEFSNLANDYSVYYQKKVRSFTKHFKTGIHMYFFMKSISLSEIYVNGGSNFFINENLDC